MLEMNDLKVGTFFIFHDGQPYEILEAHHLKMQQRRPVLQARMKNLINGKTIDHNFAQSDQFEEADISKKNVKFLYSHREEFWFCDEDNPSKRFNLDKATVGQATRFLKPNVVIQTLRFNDKILNVELPVKMDFEVKEAPPAVRGNTAQGGSKQVVLENSTVINVPLFIEAGDIVRVNTQTGDYVERATKG